MANLIDKTYFVNDIVLPKNDWDNIESFITRFEPEVLTSLLGYTLYKAMLAAPTVDPYKNLVDGVEYSIDYNGNTRLVKWNGLKNDKSISLIAYYVYCEYLRSRVTTTQQVGETLSNLENSKNADIFSKLGSAHARLNELYGYEYQDKLVPSAYNFLSEHEDDYPEWEFECIKNSINSHDL